MQVSNLFIFKVSFLSGLGFILGAVSALILLICIGMIFTGFFNGFMNNRRKDNDENKY